MIPKTIVHLLSGGLDSTVLLYDLRGQGQKIHCVLFDYGQKHIRELAFAELHCDRLGVNYTRLELPQLAGSELTDGKGGMVVPNRNAIFLSHAVNLAMAAGADEVTFAANKDDEINFPDCRMAFVQTFNNMLTTASIPVQVAAPYIDKSKGWIARLGSDLKVKPNETWSCYRGGAEPCGKCGACLKLDAAMGEPETIQKGMWAGAKRKP